MSSAGGGMVLGLDVGSVAAKGLILDTHGRVRGRASAALAGDASAAMLQVLRKLLPELARPVLVGVTGGGKGILDGLPGAVCENDLVATTRAVGVLLPAVRGIIEIGGQQSKWIRLGPGGQMESFALNDQCAAGSGAFLEQQAGRLRLDIRELCAMAASAERAASIAGRCAVFAKSDMIHLQQKGTPMPEIAYGLCVALVRNYRATLLRGSELARPCVLLGGGALNPGLVRAAREVLGLSGEDLLETPEPQFLGAYGVALAATERGSAVAAAAILRIVERRAAGMEEIGMSLQPLPVIAADARPVPETRGDREVRAYLGVDVGSVSTDLCLLSPNGEVLDGIYLRTRGDPVGVLREGLDILRERTGGNLQVLGTGTTGSGRHLAGMLLAADVVKNEITCQLLGARHVLPEVDTILEIGGQDSKYVSVRDGRISDFVMNKICAAGTGSFLEEQGESLGVSILDEFADRALRGTAPTDLGSQCTVFMESEVVRARQRRTPLPDILAGLAYSVARNYLERVVAGRPIGSRVVFQGGVASNRAVVAAFEALLGRPITVHPQNRLSGAIGAALAARDVIAGRPSSFRGLAAVESAQVDRFECRKCANRCQVGRVHAGGGVACFGDICERYSVRDGSAVTSGQPDLVREVEERLESYAGGEPRTGTAGIPRSSMMYDLFPFWATFLRRLGFRVVLPG
ncbi:MAG: CoA protein activase, partial [Deltaproteobacteria bacterium]|nr:CoA protein activase [Deltaproteobacteria bacterium]